MLNEIDILDLHSRYPWNYNNCDSLYEKGPYHAQIEFSVQGFKLKKKNFSKFFFFFQEATVHTK